MKSIVMEIGLVAFVYIGLVQGVDGAANVALFVVWVQAALRIVAGLAADEFGKRSAHEPAPSAVRIAVCRGASGVTLALLVWSGAFAAATVWALGMFMLEVARDSAARARKAAAAG